MKEHDKKTNYVTKILKQIKTENIEFVLVKGLSLKDLYENPNTRLMCDIDILVRSEDLDKLFSILKNEGYKLEKNRKSQTTYEFHKSGEYVIEIHHTLLPSSFETGTEFTERIWRRKVVGESGYYEMQVNDNVAYIISHIIKHVQNTGVGFRQFLDLTLFINRHMDILIKKELTHQLQKMRILKCSSYVIELCNFYFGLDYSLDLEIDSFYVEELFNLISRSGVYGKRNKFEIESTYLRNSINTRRSGFYKLIKVAFPSKKVLSYKYPILKSYGCLLPLIWIGRIFEKIFFEKHKVNSFIHGEVDEHVLNKRIELINFMELYN